MEQRKVTATTPQSSKIFGKSIWPKKFCLSKWANYKTFVRLNQGDFSHLINENDLQAADHSNKMVNVQQWRCSPDDSDDDDDFFVSTAFDASVEWVFRVRDVFNWFSTLQSDAETSDDENEIFYTPPSSPSQLIDDDDDEEEVEEISDQSMVPDTYSTYLLG